MDIKVLSSGSKGNTTYVDCGNIKLIIDMGNNCKYVVDKLKGLGINPRDIDAILITHTHSDHIKGLKSFVNRYNTKVYITKGMLGDLSYLETYSIMDKECFIIGDVLINTIKTSHDAPDSVGYIITHNNKSLVYITDTGYINKKYFKLLSNKDIYVLESNHDIELLSNSSYPFYLRQRILGDKGHLSNYDASRYLSLFIGDNTKYIFLAHLSEENNTPDLAYDTLIERLNEDEKDIPNVIIALQDKETELISV